MSNLQKGKVPGVDGPTDQTRRGGLGANMDTTTISCTVGRDLTRQPCGQKE